MRRRLALVIAVLLSSALLVAPATADSRRLAVQVGTYDYLLSPDFDGLVSARAASAGLTLGLGTFDRLDGELVLVGGVLYRVGTDGTPTEVTDDRTTPFFEGVRFRARASVPVPPGTTCAAMGPLVTAAAGTSAGMVAVRVRGTFSDLVTRSVEAQPLPYPSLAQAVAGQTVSQNTVHSLANTATGSVAVSVTGIYFAGPTSGTNVIARNFVHSQHRLETLLDSLTGPAIVKLYRPTPAELTASPAAPGRVELWFPKR